MVSVCTRPQNIDPCSGSAKSSGVQTHDSRVYSFFKYGRHSFSAAIFLPVNCISYNSVNWNIRGLGEFSHTVTKASPIFLKPNVFFLLLLKNINGCYFILPKVEETT